MIKYCPQHECLVLADAVTCKCMSHRKNLTLVKTTVT